MTSPPVAPTPTPLDTGRAVAPDLARGVMLLFIVVANAPFYLWGQPAGLTSAHPPGATGLDLVWQTISVIAIDGRSYPMFAFLFGYGIWQLYRRQAAAGVDRVTARRLLRKRHLWMIAFGAVHALLLWMGDVVGAYGLAGVILAAIFLDRRDFALKLTAGILTGLVALGGISSLVAGLVLPAVLPPGTFAVPEGSSDFLRIAQAEGNYLVAAGLRLGLWAAVTLLQLISLIIPIAILLAIVAARSGGAGRARKAPAAVARRGHRRDRDRVGVRCRRGPAERGTAAAFRARAGLGAGSTRSPDCAAGSGTSPRSVSSPHGCAPGLPASCGVRCRLSASARCRGTSPSRWSSPRS